MRRFEVEYFYLPYVLLARLRTKDHAQDCPGHPLRLKSRLEQWQTKLMRNSSLTSSDYLKGFIPVASRYSGPVIGSLPSMRAIVTVCSTISLLDTITLSL